MQALPLWRQRWPDELSSFAARFVMGRVDRFRLRRSSLTKKDAEDHHGSNGKKLALPVLTVLGQLATFDPKEIDHDLRRLRPAADATVNGDEIAFSRRYSAGTREASASSS